MTICSYCGSSYILVGSITKDQICGNCGRLQEKCHNCLAKDAEIERLTRDIHQISSEKDRLMSLVVAHAAEIERLRAAIRTIMDLLEQFPSGLDVDPDPDNECPDDVTAFLGGLMMVACRDAIKSEEGGEG